MDDPMMSAAYQQQQYPNNMRASIEFPNDFLESNVNTVQAQSHSKVNSVFSPNTGYSSTNSSLSSSHNRLAYDDSGISSNVTLSNGPNNSSSSMHFLSSALNTTVNDCMEPDINYDNSDLLDDFNFEPIMRDRCHTWPNQRATNNEVCCSSSLIHERIPEEESFYSRNGSQTSVHLTQDPFTDNTKNVQTSNSLNYDGPPHNDYSGDNSPESESDELQGELVQKRSQTRRNAWGNMSYADLITQAIQSAPDQRLTLSQIYEWMTLNVPYFADKGDSNSSAGWKNSIRHNLSLHNRFMRIQNEGAGKSSWWILNPDAKSRNPRRRATMDASTKHAIEKKRRGARRKVEVMEQQESLNPSNRTRKASHLEFFYNHRGKDEIDQDSDYDSFCSRTISNISAAGGSQVSPTFNPNNPNNSNNESFNYSPNFGVQPEQCSTMREIMHKTDHISLNTADEEFGSLNNRQFFSAASQQISPKYHRDEASPSQFQQGSYQELKPVHGVDQGVQNPLLHNHYGQQTQFFNHQQQRTRNYPFGYKNATNQQRMQAGNQQQTYFVQPNNFQQPMSQMEAPPPQLTSPVSVSRPATTSQAFAPMVDDIPKDLENLQVFIPPDCDLKEIDKIIEEELATPSIGNF